MAIFFLLVVAQQIRPRAGVATEVVIIRHGRRQMMCDFRALGIQLTPQTPMVVFLPNNTYPLGRVLQFNLHWPFSSREAPTKTRRITNLHILHKAQRGALPMAGHGVPSRLCSLLQLSAFPHAVMHKISTLQCKCDGVEWSNDFDIAMHIAKRF